jgi:hypothetical protein
MAKMCGTTLHAFVAAFVIGFFALSGASAQSGNPIKVGMSLALTGLRATRSLRMTIQRALRRPGPEPGLLSRQPAGAS